MLSKLQDLGYDRHLFALHSLRSGGASAAANLGVNDWLFKRHGCWWSENAKDGYVKDSQELRLAVTKNIQDVFSFFSLFLSFFWVFFLFSACCHFLRTAL